MKKLMIAAASAVMVGSAFAVGEAQVYDFTATIKSGVCRQARVTRALMNYFDQNRAARSVYWNQYATGDEIGLRKQMSMKIGGVIWGCDCDTIARPYWGNPRALPSRYLSGYMFWNETTEELYVPFTWAAPTQEVTTFRWLVLNRIDAMTKCEGSFVLNARWPSQRLLLQGAGFGTVKNTGCDTVISTISGNIAGWRFAANEAYGCVFCAANGCVVAPICDQCLEFGLLGMDTRMWTAASGTWKLKYNQTATRRLRRNPYISKTYSFPRKSGQAALFAEVADRVNAWLNGLNYASYDDDDEEDIDVDEKDSPFEDFDLDALEETDAILGYINSLGSWATMSLDDASEALEETFTDEELEAIESFEENLQEAFGTLSDES